MKNKSFSNTSALPWQKLEMHAHTDEDFLDGPDIPYSIFGLIDEASKRGYGMLAWTGHLRMPGKERLRKAREYAQGRGILLIPGVEYEIGGRHILLYFDYGLDHNRIIKSIRALSDIRALKKKGVIRLVGAPHPFYPFNSMQSTLMEKYQDVFDFIELNWFYTETGTFLPEFFFDRNKEAVRFGRRHHIPILACGDLHRLDEFSKEVSFVRCEKDLESFYSLFKKLKDNGGFDSLIRYESRPLPRSSYLRYTVRLILGLGIYHLRKLRK